jgi:hypothetical protein
MGPRAGLDGAENLVPTGIRSADRPARSESLYRMSYPGPKITGSVQQKCNVSVIFTDCPGNITQRYM